MARLAASLLIVLLAALPVAGRLCDAACDGAQAAPHHHHHQQESPKPDPCGHDHVAGRTAVTAAKASAPTLPVAALAAPLAAPIAAIVAVSVLELHRPPDLPPSAPRILRI